MRKGTGIGIGVAVVVVAVIAVASMGNSPLAQIANTVQNGTSTDAETTSAQNQTIVTSVTKTRIETLRVHLLDDSYTIPPNGSQQIVFTTASADKATIYGNATLSSDSLVRMELKPNGSSCGLTNCSTHTIHGNASAGGFAYTGQIKLSTDTNSEMSLILSNPADYEQSVILNLDVVYEYKEQS